MTINGTNFQCFNQNHEIVLTSDSVILETSSPIEIIRHTRYGMGNEYNEKIYCCPKCKAKLAYFNGVTFINKPTYTNYCPNCGERLNWNEGLNE